MMAVSLAFLIVINAFLVAPAEGETVSGGKKLAEEGEPQVMHPHTRGCLTSQRCRDGED